MQLELRGDDHHQRALTAANQRRQIEVLDGDPRVELLENHVELIARIPTDSFGKARTDIVSVSFANVGDTARESQRDRIASASARFEPRALAGGEDDFDPGDVLARSTVSDRASAGGVVADRSANCGLRAG